MSDALAAALFPNLVGWKDLPVPLQLRCAARIYPNMTMESLCWAALDGIFINKHNIAQAHDMVLGRGPHPGLKATV